MPAALIQQLAQHIAALHQYGTALLATGAGQQPADVHHNVRCVHTPEGYFVWVGDYAAITESTDAGSQAILLLSNDDDTYLSWVGSTHAVSPQEHCYQRIMALLERHWQQCRFSPISWCDCCLLRLIPRCGRFFRTNQEDLALSQDDLVDILNWRVAA